MQRDAFLTSVLLRSLALGRMLEFRRPRAFFGGWRVRQGEMTEAVWSGTENLEEPPTLHGESRASGKAPAS